MRNGADNKTHITDDAPEKRSLHQRSIAMTSESSLTSQDTYDARHIQEVSTSCDRCSRPSGW